MKYLSILLLVILTSCVQEDATVIKKTTTSTTSSTSTTATQIQTPTPTTIIQILVPTPTTVQAPSSMKIGMNFWNYMWDGYTNFFVEGVNWSTTTHPWTTQIITDAFALSGPIRFMDLDAINSNPITQWSQRIVKTDNHYDMSSYPKGKHISIDPTIQKYYQDPSYLGGTYTHWGIAYEWMIDLCNKSGRDLWINIPTFSNSAYWTSLATLIKNNLNPELKVYVEYSNEVWNGAISIGFPYSLDQGALLGLPGMNKWYQGGSWYTYQSLKIFKTFQDVFGVANTGIDKRLVRVLAFSGNSDIANESIRTVIYNGSATSGYNSKWNPNGQKPDLLAIAPYIGPNDDAKGSGKLDGASSDVAARFRANVDWNFTNYITPFKTIADRYGYSLGCYEAGQQFDTNADKWSRNQAIYDEYTYMLNKWIPAKFVVCNHYTLYASYGAGSAWGLKNKATDENTKAISPKFKAVVDWIKSH